jgi:hypothetical protein
MPSPDAFLPDFVNLISYINAGTLFLLNELGGEWIATSYLIFRILGG